MLRSAHDSHKPEPTIAMIRPLRNCARQTVAYLRSGWFSQAFFVGWLASFSRPRSQRSLAGREISYLSKPDKAMSATFLRGLRVEPPRAVFTCNRSSSAAMARV
jgi:hypothetical protein